MKPSAVQLLQERVQQAGLANVTAVLGRIEEYQGGLVWRVFVVQVCASVCVSVCGTQFASGIVSRRT